MKIVNLLRLITLLLPLPLITSLVFIIMLGCSEIKVAHPSVIADGTSFTYCLGEPKDRTYTLSYECDPPMGDLIVEANVTIVTRGYKLLAHSLILKDHASVMYDDSD